MLPFQITRMLGLKSKTHGFALVNEQGIKLVFRDAEDIQASPDEEADSLLVEWSNVARWESKRGYLSDQFVIEVHTSVGDEPDGRNDKVLELELQKRDRDRLERFEKHVKEYQSGKRKDDVDDVLDDVQDMLDKHSGFLEEFGDTE